MGGVIAFPSQPARWAPRLADDFSGLTHDLRNVMASLELCAEVLAEPGVLMPEHTYLAGEIRSVADASIGLLRQIGRLAECESSRRNGLAVTPPEAPATADPEDGRLASFLARRERLLAAVAGPQVDLQIACAPCWGRFAMSGQDLERVLINLVRNAGEAMPAGGHIRITAQMAGGQSFGGAHPGLPLAPAQAVVLSVQDNGPGIPAHLASHIFEPGFSARTAVSGVLQKNARCRATDPSASGKETPRGLGLAIARDLVESCGGSLVLVPSVRGARFEIELPLTNVTPPQGLSSRIPVKGGRA